MAGLDRITRRAAVSVVFAVAVVTFAALTALAGGKEDPVDATPNPVTIAEPAVPEPALTQTAEPVERPTQTAVGPPAESESEADREAMEAQGERDGGAAAGAATGAESREPLAKQVGRMIMTGYSGQYPSQTVLRRVRRGEVGGIILMGENVSAGTSAAIGALQQAARQAGRSLVIATDQEGGSVKRFTGPPASSAAGMGSAQTARAQGRATGQLLSQAGVNVDLAPVADVQHSGGFLGTRAFSSIPATVARRACAFASGLQSAGVLATLKHFPGLGYATENTDIAAETITQPAGALGRDLAAYQSCKPGLVMVSNAVYSAYDPGTPAVFSRKIIDGLLRGQLGFRGVVISDSLTAASVTSPTTAVRAAQAGVDILLYIPEQISGLAYQKVLAAARSGEISRARIRAAADRIEQLTQ